MGFNHGQCSACSTTATRLRATPQDLQEVMNMQGKGMLHGHLHACTPLTASWLATVSYRLQNMAREVSKEWHTESKPTTSGMTNWLGHGKPTMAGMTEPTLAVLESQQWLEYQSQQWLGWGNLAMARIEEPTLAVLWKANNGCIDRANNGWVGESQQWLK